MKDNLVIKQIFEVDDDLAEQISREMDEGTHWDIEQGRLFLQDRNNALFVASIDQNVVGFISGYKLQRFDSKKSEVLLYEISVNEKYRQKGIGKALIESFKKWSKDNGSSEIWVLTNQKNTAAMALYKSTGGKIGEENVVMLEYGV